MENNLIDFGKRLFELRAALGKSKTQFADELGIVHQKVKQYEEGGVIPKIDFLHLLCSKYPVNMTWLVVGTGDMFVSGYVNEATPLSTKKEKTALSNSDGWADKMIASLELQLNRANMEKDKLLALLEK